MNVSSQFESLAKEATTPHWFERWPALTFACTLTSKSTYGLLNLLAGYWHTRKHYSGTCMLSFLAQRATRAIQFWHRELQLPFVMHNKIMNAKGWHPIRNHRHTTDNSASAGLLRVMDWASDLSRHDIIVSSWKATVSLQAKNESIMSLRVWPCQQSQWMQLWLQKQLRDPCQGLGAFGRRSGTASTMLLQLHHHGKEIPRELWQLYAAS